MQQSEVRKEMIARRKALLPEERQQMGKSAAAFLLSLPEVKAAKTVMVYLPVLGELPTEALIAGLSAAGKTLLYPVTLGAEMVAAKPLSSQFVKGDFGVQVPQEYEIVPKPDVVIVPLSAVDKRKFRVGYGKGYYDKFLAQTQAFSVGFCYRFQIVERVQENPWEVPLNALVCEDEIIR